MISLDIPDKVDIEIKDCNVIIKGSLGINTRNFNDALIEVKKDNKKLIIQAKKDNKILLKKGKMAENSFAKELTNDMEGTNKYFEINMQTVFAHFPITIEVKGEKIFIKNIIGERAPRISQIVGNTKVEIKGQNVRIYGTKIDDVSQTAANIRKTCKMRNKDNRIFQDGIYKVQ
ncbi:MAG: 50S ribosomal protein L6 [Candidatus Marsarchaeota archaeon]|jgi:large subunit ribosomal protein L6|nr:50S ribosomal protein L6 [Candidatus Marsarchaeota archaeon]